MATRIVATRCLLAHDCLQDDAGFPVFPAVERTTSDSVPAEEANDEDVADAIVDHKAGRSKKDALSRRESIKSAPKGDVVKRGMKPKAKELDTMVESLMKVKPTRESRPRLEICGKAAGRRLYITTLFVDQLPSWPSMAQDFKRADIDVPKDISTQRALLDNSSHHKNEQTSLIRFCCMTQNTKQVCQYSVT